MVSSFGRGCCNQAATARGGRSQLPLHPDSKLIKRASQPCRARSRASSQLCQCLGKVAGEKVPRSWGNNPPPSLEANRPPLSLHPPQFCQVPSACHAQASPSSERVVPGRASMLIYGFSWHIALPGQEHWLRPTADPHWHGSRPGKSCWDPLNRACGDQEPARTWRDLGRDVLRVAVGKGDSGVLHGHWALHCKSAESWVPWWGKRAEGAQERKTRLTGR